MPFSAASIRAKQIEAAELSSFLSLAYLLPAMTLYDISYGIAFSSASIPIQI